MDENLKKIGTDVGPLNLVDFFPHGEKNIRSFEKKEKKMIFLKAAAAFILGIVVGIVVLILCPFFLAASAWKTGEVLR